MIPAETAFRDELRRWLAARPAPAVRPDGFPAREEIREFSSALHAAGFAGVSWPVEHGGRGLPAAFDAIAAEELVRAGRGDHVGIIGLGMVGPAILAVGTADQRNRFLPRILSGETLFCQGFSEPEAGSDLAALRTSATEAEGMFVVDGHKLWSTGAPVADHCLLLARTEPGSRGHRGLSCLLVDLRTEGVTVRPLRQLSGETRFGELLFDQVPVPADAVLGPVGGGWRVAMTTLAHERGTFGVRLAAALSAEFAEFTAMLRRRGLDRDPVARDRVARVWIEVAGVRAAAHRVAGAEPGPEASIVKLRWSRAEQRLAALAFDLLGDGDSADHARWRHARLRSRGATLEGGTSEVLRDVLAERVLGLPRAR
ncbi:acyl-CoA dehydrogenase family protein [Amycolatopsis sp. NPDC059090]|uniref:acyl-CoA dehydrogenase family protein n=1 Tax=unclassified Amycolatopsis TaxID=2618356 RepID=UPI00366D096A